MTSLRSATAAMLTVGRYEIPDPQIESNTMSKIVNLKNRGSQIIE